MKCPICKSPNITISMGCLPKHQPGSYGTTVVKNAIMICRSCNHTWNDKNITITKEYRKGKRKVKSFVNKDKIKFLK